MRHEMGDPISTGEMAGETVQVLLGGSGTIKIDHVGGESTQQWIFLTPSAAERLAAQLRDAARLKVHGSIEKTHSSLTPREIIKGLLERATKCMTCGAPATYSCPTAEIGYRLCFCDDHKRSGKDELGDEHPPREFTNAAVVRAAVKFLAETEE